MTSRTAASAGFPSVESSRAKRPSRYFLAGAAVLWVTAVGVGMGVLFSYSVTPGAQAHAPPRWPDDTRLSLASGVHTLVFVAHPRCSCTRASIAELARLMTRLSGRLRGSVLFVKPAGVDEDWERTDLWSSAAIIDGIQVIGDERGEEAARFGARTSGQVYLYAPDGRLLFQGGITPTRSHQGDSVGRKRIIDLVTEGTADRAESSVYGCALSDAEKEDFWFAGVQRTAASSQ